MRYESSEAVRLDGYDMRSNMREASASPSFDVYEGGGLDARVRQGVTHQFLVKLVRVALVAAAICALGFARVAISTATVSAGRSTKRICRDKASRGASEDKCVLCPAELLWWGEMIGRI